MRKRKMAVLSLLIYISLLLSGCGSDWYQNVEKQTVSSKLNTAVLLSDTDLYSRAAKEMENGAVMDFYSTTSTAESAARNFMEKYPKLEGKIRFREIDDADTYGFLTEEIQNETGAVDMMITQNGADLEKKLISTGLALRYFPQAYMETVNSEFRLPAAVCLANTLFIYNTVDGAMTSNNIWQFTETERKGTIYFKNPLDETENINFLVMLTSPEWTEKITLSYRDYFGKEWTPHDEYPSAAYEWIDLFLKNCDFGHGSNSQICADVANADTGVMGLFVYSKVRKLEDEQKQRLSVMAYEGEADCFTGYMYATYATVAQNTDCPYTCALFINYLISEEGFCGEGSWNNYQGYYSANTTVRKPEDLEDRDFSFWKDTLVVEDSDFIPDNADKVTEFIEARLKAVD